jgi:phospho-N-acetylmuramoyl-pentapeptide-transferase
MEFYLIATVVSFLVHFLLIVPFINLLYKIRFQRANQETKDAFNNPTPIFDLFHKHKFGTPVGGGILIVLTTIVLFAVTFWLLTLGHVAITSNYNAVFTEIKILFFHLYKLCCAWGVRRYQ